jgi:hypothetical protein
MKGEINTLRVWRTFHSNIVGMDAFPEKTNRRKNNSATHLVHKSSPVGHCWQKALRIPVCWQKEAVRIGHRHACDLPIPIRQICITREPPDTSEKSSALLGL